ncbi:MAG TPA: ribosome biogenesis GTPase YlqF, partial [Lachnospiraceae bacterium]|nr:ribosome biogenesis GTPase YlqF [Lachnospiraceae bacterium]
EIDSLAQNKSRIILLNKYDLASMEQTNAWKAWFEAHGFFVALVNSKNGNGVKNVHEVIQQACKEKIERDRKRGILNRPVRAMVVGIPNVGKSTFINSFAGRACAKTGNKPGVTKGKQWIKLNKNVELLDTPGILWPKFEDQLVGLRLAFIGSIKEEILNITELALELIKFLQEYYKGILAKKYEVEESSDSLETLTAIAIKRGCKLKGDIPDINKAAGIVIDDFRNGRIGRITLEFPESKEESTEENKKENKEASTNE